MFFTGGRTYTQNFAIQNSPAKIIQNTLISSAFSGLLSFSLKPLVFRTTGLRQTKHDALTLSNGILIGLVSIAGVAQIAEAWAAVLIGSISAFWYVGGVLFLEFYRIDDALEVFPVHALGGVWGLLAVGFFSPTQGALYYDAFRQGHFFGYQVIGIVVIAAWTSLLSIPAFVVLRKLHLLRVDVAVEEVGLDIAELSGVSEEFLDAVRDQIRAKEAKGIDDEAGAEEVEEEDEEQKRLREEKERAALKAKARGPPKQELQGEEFIF